MRKNGTIIIVTVAVLSLFLHADSSTAQGCDRTAEHPGWKESLVVLKSTVSNYAGMAASIMCDKDHAVTTAHKVHGSRMAPLTGDGLNHPIIWNPPHPITPHVYVPALESFILH